MNLQETLEQLSQVAGDWIDTKDTSEGKIYRMLDIHDWYLPMDFFTKSDTLWQLFGAICDKMEAEGLYFDMDNHGNPDDPEDKIKYSIIISSETRQIATGYSESSLAHAAAKALLAALQAKEQSTQNEQINE